MLSKRDEKFENRPPRPTIYLFYPFEFGLAGVYLDRYYAYAILENFEHNILSGLMGRAIAGLPCSYMTVQVLRQQGMIVLLIFCTVKQCNRPLRTCSVSAATALGLADNSAS